MATQPPRQASIPATTVIRGSSQLREQSDGPEGSEEERLSMVAFERADPRTADAVDAVAAWPGFWPASLTHHKRTGS
jgi:hypothetical protein